MAMSSLQNTLQWDVQNPPSPDNLSRDAMSRMPSDVLMAFQARHSTDVQGVFWMEMAFKALGQELLNKYGITMTCKHQTTSTWKSLADSIHDKFVYDFHSSFWNRLTTVDFKNKHAHDPQHLLTRKQIDFVAETNQAQPDWINYERLCGRSYMTNQTLNTYADFSQTFRAHCREQKPDGVLNCEITMNNTCTKFRVYIEIDGTNKLADRTTEFYKLGQAMYEGTEGCYQHNPNVPAFTIRCNWFKYKKKSNSSAEVAKVIDELKTKYNLIDAKKLKDEVERILKQEIYEKTTLATSFLLDMFQSNLWACADMVIKVLREINHAQQHSKFDSHYLINFHRVSGPMFGMSWQRSLNQYYQSNEIFPQRGIFANQAQGGVPTLTNCNFVVHQTNVCERINIDRIDVQRFDYNTWLAQSRAAILQAYYFLSSQTAALSQNQLQQCKNVIIQKCQIMGLCVLSQWKDVVRQLIEFDVQYPTLAPHNLDPLCFFLAKYTTLPRIPNSMRFDFFHNNADTPQYERFDSYYFRAIQQCAVFYHQCFRTIFDSLIYGPEGAGAQDWTSLEPSLDQLTELLRQHPEMFQNREQYSLDEKQYFNGLAYTEEVYENAKCTNLGAVLCKSHHKTLPALDPSLHNLIKKYNIPNMELFLRLIRCNNLPALRTLAEQFASGALQESLKPMLQQMPVTTESELRWLFSQITQHFQHLDLSLSPGTEVYDQILNRHILGLSGTSPLLSNLFDKLSAFSPSTEFQYDEKSLKNTDQVLILHADTNKKTPLNSKAKSETVCLQTKTDGPNKAITLEAPDWLTDDQTLHGVSAVDVEKQTEMSILLTPWDEFEKELHKISETT